MSDEEVWDGMGGMSRVGSLTDPDHKSKSALLACAEIIQATRTVRYVAMRQSFAAIDVGQPEPMPEEEVADSGLSAEEVTKLETEVNPLSKEESALCTSLIGYCREIDCLANKIIVACIDFVPPL
jgi:hypothetical protein